jgi:hypothetical protein
MGLWLTQPKLEENETIRWQSSAGRLLGKWITSGGQLIVTNQRVLFLPNRFDRLIGKKRWECPLASVRGFGALERAPTVVAGGRRKRLKIQASDNHEIFIVNHLDEKMSELEGLFLNVRDWSGIGCANSTDEFDYDR